jgi:hypothetical protein
MYKILNKLFGWDYVYYKTENYEGIARIIVLPDKSVHFWHLNNLINIEYKKMHIKFLTCTPDKYIK